MKGEGEIIEVYKTDVYKLANLSREVRRDRAFKPGSREERRRRRRRNEFEIGPDPYRMEEFDVRTS